MANPAFSTNPAFNGKGVPTIPTPSAEQLQTQFELPSAPDPAAAAPMTVDGTVRTTLGTFAVLLLGAAIGWVTMPIVPFLFVGAAIVGFVLALVNIFKREPSPALILAYAGAQGVFLVAMVGYLVFSLINVGLMVFGVSTDPWGLRTGVEIFGIPLGVILGVLAVLLGAYSLVLDFDFIQKGAQNRIPKKYQWTGAFGVMVTVIWLYLEILRLIAILRR